MRLSALFLVSAILLGRVSIAAAQQMQLTPDLLAQINAKPPTGPMPELATVHPWFNASPVSNAALRGHVVLLDFWEYDCEVCRQDLPTLLALAAKYRPTGVQVIAIHPALANFTSDTSTVARAIRAAKIPFPVVYDSAGTLVKAFHNVVYPTRFYVDKQGNVRDMGTKSTEAALNELLAEPAAPANSHEANLHVASPRGGPACDGAGDEVRTTSA